jgi:hypothetical protein
MKSDLINWVLTLMLCALAVAVVILALQAIFLTHEFRSMSVEANLANGSLAQVRALANDVAVYNQKSPSPELTRLLGAVQGKPAGR